MTQQRTKLVRFILCFNLFNSSLVFLQRSLFKFFLVFLILQSVLFSLIFHLLNFFIFFFQPLLFNRPFWYPYLKRFFYSKNKTFFPQQIFPVRRYRLGKEGERFDLANRLQINVQCPISFWCEKLYKFLGYFLSRFFFSSQFFILFFSLRFQPITEKLRIHLS